MNDMTSNFPGRVAKARWCFVMLLGSVASPGFAQAPTVAAANAAATASGSSTAKDIDRIVAVVNNEVITALELAGRMRSVELQLKRQNIEIPPQDVLRSQVLDRLIVDRAQVQLARDIGVRVDDAQVDRAVAGIAEQNRMTMPQLRDRIEREGSTFARFRGRASFSGRSRLFGERR